MDTLEDANEHSVDSESSPRPILDNTTMLDLLDLPPLSPLTALDSDSELDDVEVEDETILPESSVRRSNRIQALTSVPATVSTKQKANIARKPQYKPYALRERSKEKVKADAHAKEKVPRKPNALQRLKAEEEEKGPKRKVEADKAKPPRKPNALQRRKAEDKKKLRFSARNSLTSPSESTAPSAVNDARASAPPIEEPTVTIDDRVAQETTPPSTLADNVDASAPPPEEPPVTFDNNQVVQNDESQLSNPDSTEIPFTAPVAPQRGSESSLGEDPSMQRVSDSSADNTRSEGLVAGREKLVIRIPYLPALVGDTSQQGSRSSTPSYMTTADTVKLRVRRPPVHQPEPPRARKNPARKSESNASSSTEGSKRRMRSRASTRSRADPSEAINTPAQFMQLDVSSVSLLPESTTVPLAPPDTWMPTLSLSTPALPQSEHPLPVSVAEDYATPPHQSVDVRAFPHLALYLPPPGPPPGWYPPDNRDPLDPASINQPYLPRLLDASPQAPLQTPTRSQPNTGLPTPVSLPRVRLRVSEPVAPGGSGRKRKAEDGPSRQKRARTTTQVLPSIRDVVPSDDVQLTPIRKRKAKANVGPVAKRARAEDKQSPGSNDAVQQLPSHEPWEGALRLTSSQLPFLDGPLDVAAPRDSKVTAPQVDSSPVQPAPRPRRWRDFPPSSDSSPCEQLPLPPGAWPLAWAHTRQEICETLAWFRTYQGGVYMSHGIATGYLLGGFSSPRDAFLHHGKLIISHGGGGTTEVDEPDTIAADGAPKAKTRARVLTKNQTGKRPHARTLEAAYRKCAPMLVLADNRYELFPYKFPEKAMYCVLGWYWIKELWAEPEPNPKSLSSEPPLRMKVGLQWVESQGDPWWWPNTHIIRQPTPVNSATGTAQPRRRPKKVREVALTARDVKDKVENVASCLSCKEVSQVVYSDGWMCLNDSCAVFWTLEDGSSPCGEGLAYDNGFTALEKTPPLTDLIGSVDYRHHVPEPDGSYKFTTSHHFQRGLCCPKCGRISCRSMWECWKCASCGYEVAVEWPIHTSAAWQPLDGVPQLGEYKIHDDAIRFKRFSVIVDDAKNHALVNAFVLPEDRGIIYQILNNSSIGSLAEDVLQRYQLEFSHDPLFRRHPLAMHMLESSLLTQYFSQNSGVPYKFVASVNRTLSFEESPSAVTGALELIHKRAQLVVPEAQFNELLTAGYLGSQQMNCMGNTWVLTSSLDSDFEAGLGNDVASLSLASPAHMKFRARSKDPKSRGVILELTLHHGDVLVMHGIGVQRHYEHMVSPMGFRIASTARFIDQKQNGTEKTAVYKGAAAKLQR